MDLLHDDEHYEMEISFFFSRFCSSKLLSSFAGAFDDDRLTQLVIEIDYALMWLARSLHEEKGFVAAENSLIFAIFLTPERIIIN